MQYKSGDTIVVLAIFFNIMAVITTNYLTYTINSFTQTTNSSVEGNPVQASLFNLPYVNFIIHVLIYTCILVFYMMLKRMSIKHNDIQTELMYDFFTVFIFLFFAYDFFNDLGIVAGVIFHMQLK